MRFRLGFAPHRDIAAAWKADAQGAIAPFMLVIGSQAFSQLARLDPDDRVRARIVVRRAVKHRYAERIFLESVLPSSKGLLNHIPEELLQLCGFAEPVAL